MQIVDTHGRDVGNEYKRPRNAAAEDSINQVLGRGLDGRHDETLRRSRWPVFLARCLASLLRLDW